MYTWDMHPALLQQTLNATSPECLMFRWYLLSTWIVSCRHKKNSKFWPHFNIPTSHLNSLRPVADYNWPSTCPVKIGRRLSLVYHNVVPTVCAQLEGDRTKITKAVVVGSFIPFVMQHHSLLKNLVPFLKLMLRMWTIYSTDMYWQFLLGMLKGRAVSFRKRTVIFSFSRPFVP